LFIAENFRDKKSQNRGTAIMRRYCLVSDFSLQGGSEMIRMVFAAAIAALAFTAVSGVSQAAPIAPLPAAAASDAGTLTPVYYRWHHHHCWWRHGYRHCW
jgi:hypothetical protein